MLNRRYALSLAMTLSFVTMSYSTEANMSYTPYVYELVQHGSDMEVKIQVFEDASLSVIPGEVPLPGIDSQYTLVRRSSGSNNSVTVFADKEFSESEAIEVTGYECQTLAPWDDECENETDCHNCDGNGEGYCDGFCAIAYRFSVIDECVPEGEVSYWITSPEVEEPGVVTGEGHAFLIEGEGLGFTNGYVNDHGVDCSDSICSVATVGGKCSGGMNLLNLLARLGMALF